MGKKEGERGRGRKNTKPDREMGGRNGGAGSRK